mmetsp:Transcript_4483/g.6211  ORF Transcript_4483/g.6211 Transcript_4483/m.6211 type:complete len:140 (+) Transcript_4483:292-711(+)|eukprot:CAMPEP_0194054286 /NCGR_PEP_ID=MMETSP0009_2-20130614/52960_1 /TAXON_ID=210454 /ORGANISM="Grammatophora oceanica, Strain CCMP 410" /LENGTH=139 /DNA_ID=CAMNT_0038702729 /DNA_START=285 /DNA_END=704 /DNA_ORIENTATION=-
MCTSYRPSPRRHHGEQPQRAKGNDDQERLPSATTLDQEEMILELRRSTIRKILRVLRNRHRGGDSAQYRRLAHLSVIMEYHLWERAGGCVADYDDDRTLSVRLRAIVMEQRQRQKARRQQQEADGDASSRKSINNNCSY